MRPVSNRGSFFQYVQGMNPGRSAFDLSYQRHLTCKFGLLYPVYIQEALPGDFIKAGADALIRMQPTTAPTMSDIKAVYHLFFVPKRLLWKNFEDFITRGKDGNKIVPMITWPRRQAYVKETSGSINYERAVEKIMGQNEANLLAELLGYAPRTSPLDIDHLWDHLELPPRVNPSACDLVDDTVRRAYSLIWNDYYRDENLTEEIQNIDGDGVNPDDNGIVDCAYYPITNNNGNVSIFSMQWLLPRAWKKDYFTSALPWPQRGIAPAIPLTGFASATWEQNQFVNRNFPDTQVNLPATINNTKQWFPNLDGATSFKDGTFGVKGTPPEQLMQWFNSNKIDVANLGTFTPVDLRVAFSVQRFQELQARGGARYIETLRSQWGESPSDARLQRPEYIGGCKIPIVISEVVQTSESGNTPQGNMAGHGASVSGNFIGKYKVEEYGWFIGLLSFEVSTGYQQGIPRWYTRMSTFEYPWPVFAGLSEQDIKEREIFLPRNTTQAQNAKQDRIFGFQARFNECRTRQNVVTGQMRVYSNDDYTGGYVAQPATADLPPASLAYWNFARYFAQRPLLNWHFMVSQPRLDNYLVQVEPPFIVQWYNNIHMVRKLPYQGVPSII